MILTLLFTWKALGTLWFLIDFLELEIVDRNSKWFKAINVIVMLPWLILYYILQMMRGKTSNNGQ